MSDLPDWMMRAHARATQRPAVLDAVDGPPVPYRSPPRPRPMPRQMRPAEQRAMDPNRGVSRQAWGEINRRAAADPATLPRTAGGNQFAEAGAMALEGTGLPSIRRGAADVTRAALNRDPGQAFGQLGSGAFQLGLGALGAASIGEFGAVRPPAPRAPFQRVGPSLADLTDEGGGGLIMGALRRRGAPMNDAAFEQNMPVRRVPLGQIRTTDTTPPEAQFVERYVQNPSAEPIQVLRNRDGGYDLVDGHHRLAAARQRGLADIEALDASGYAFPPETVRAPTPAFDPSPPLTRPPTEIAPNGMPIRPAQPFRNSLRGGNDDLAEAARMRAPAQDGEAARSFADEPFGPMSRRLGNDSGHIVYTPKGYGWRINESRVNRDQRGQGIGIGLYEELISRARAAGVPEVFSDVSTSQGAQGIYAALERRGYRVLREDGEYGPRFRVSTEAPTAPPALQAPTLPPQGALRAQPRSTSPGFADEAPALGIFGRRNGARDMQPEAIQGIRAYHGSPHDFDRFRWDATTRGTGEGAQAFGDGLYFAENEGVARSYRDALAARLPWSPEDTAAAYLRDANGDVQLVLDNVRKSLNMEITPALRQRQESVLRFLEDRIAGGEALPQDWRRGRMYEVNINANPEDFLNWDAPLKDQGQNMVRAISNVTRQPQKVIQNAPGRTLMDLIRARAATKLKSDADFAVEAPAAASEMLRNAGVPGIRFLDQASRAAGEGTRNYVVFDDSLIEILRKYGIAGLTAGGAGAGALSQNQGPST